MKIENIIKQLNKIFFLYYRKVFLFIRSSFNKIKAHPMNQKIILYYRKVFLFIRSSFNKIKTHPVNQKIILYYRKVFLFIRSSFNKIKAHPVNQKIILYYRKVFLFIRSSFNKIKTHPVNQKIILYYRKVFLFIRSSFNKIKAHPVNQKIILYITQRKWFLFLRNQKIILYYRKVFLFIRSSFNKIKAHPVNQKIILYYRKVFLFIRSSFNKIKAHPVNQKIIQYGSRYAFTFIFGLFSTLILFFIMSILISGGGDLNKTSSDSYSINFIMKTSLDQLKMRDRRIPKKPKEPQAPPAAPQMKVKAEIPKTPKMKAQNIPKLSLAKDFTSNLKGVAVGSGSSGDSEVTPIVRIEPLYPRKAALRGLEGFVILSFDITALGTVSGVKVLQASPPQIFNQNAKRALRRWKYKPKTRAGKPVKQKGLKVKLEFKLDKQ